MSIVAFILSAIDQKAYVGGGVVVGGTAIGGTAAYKHATSVQAQITKLAQEHGKDFIDLALKGYEAASAAILTAKQTRDAEKLATQFGMSKPAASALVTKQISPREILQLGIRSQQAP